MTIDLLIDFSRAVKDLPYDWRFAGFNGCEGGYSVELVSKCGQYHGSGVSERSFVDAFTRAEKDLQRNQEADAADFDEDEQAMFLMGTGRT